MTCIYCARQLNQESGTFVVTTTIKKALFGQEEYLKTDERLNQGNSSGEKVKKPLLNG